jgi:ribosomal protein S18 acetylase RimI-like enzyme
MTSATTREPVEIETATKTEEKDVVDTLVLAFSSDPIMRWFYPSPNEYTRHFPEFVRRYGGKAFDHGTAHHSSDLAAAALWLPPGVRPDEDALVAMFQNSLSEQRQERAWSVLEQLDEYHPTEPFWHLPVIGTDPTRQRKGYGSALLEHALERCDQEGELAYLESSNPLNIPLYSRYGFEIRGTIQEGTMPPLIPMVRTPRD